jgi:hypothetical protein
MIGFVCSTQSFGVIMITGAGAVGDALAGGVAGAVRHAPVDIR